VQTKITLVIDNPADPDAFESDFPNLLDLARTLPEIVRIESGRVWPKDDATPTPAHRILDFYFNDYEAASRAVASPEAGVFFGRLGTMNGAVSMGLFSEVEE